MRIEQRQDPFNQELKPETERLVEDYQTARRAMQDRLTPYKPHVDVPIDVEQDTPFATVHIGDTHLSHDDSEPTGLKDAVEQVDEHSIAILQSNIIDSITAKFGPPQPMGNAFSLGQQERIARDILQPLADNDQLIGIGKNFCHEGWAHRTADHDVIPAMTPASAPLLFTGGQVRFVDEDGEKLGSVEVYHNSGKGRTLLSPDGSVRARSREVPFGYPEKADAVVDAHMHQLFAAQDVISNPITREDEVVTYGEVGASKGTYEHPDKFLIGLGVPPRHQPAEAGQGFMLLWKKHDEGLRPYPVATYERGKVLFEAERLWEDAQRTQNIDELKEMVAAANPEPTVVFSAEDSIARAQDAAAKAEGQEPIYKTARHEIDSTLPVIVQFLGNLRVGSTTFEREKLTEVLSAIEQNPWAFAYATRRLLNQGVSGQKDREDVLEDLAELLTPIKDNLMGVMMTDEMRANRWASGKDKVFPGDYLAQESAIAGTPLLAPETVSNVKVGETDYTLYLRDKLSNLTSLINPYHGMTRVQQLWGVNADVLVGGHTEIAGWRTWMRPWGQQEIVVPGGFSEFIEKGVANRVDYPKGGQGVILFPDGKRIYSFATPEDGKDMHEALWLREGLKNLQMLEDVKRKLGRRSQPDYKLMQ